MTLISNLAAHTDYSEPWRDPRGKYRYMEELKRLDNAHGASVPVVDPRLSPIITPLNLGAWSKCLEYHPDKAFVQYILTGVTQGFRVGFNTGARLRPAKRNIPSADQHPEVISDYIQKEKAAGRILGPFTPSDLEPSVQISRFGVIPKGHTPGKWRLILDLSYPEGASVNDGIHSENCSIKYLKIEEVAQALLNSGPGTAMAKIDIQSAYRIVPVAPADRHLLGMAWQGRVYVDAVLPFGLRSAPIVFNAIADALLWVLRQHGIRVIFQYLDDFFTLGAPGTEECAKNMRIMKALCELLGIPLSPEKCLGPLLILIYLGFEFDTMRMEIRLPKEKLDRIRKLIREWAGKASCSVQQLESLIGKLQHVSAVVRPGRSFLHRMIALLTAARKRGRFVPIRLNKEFQTDIAWWNDFLMDWNGISLMRLLAKEPTQVTVTTDASGSWGCGRYILPGNQWFFWQWDHRIQSEPIAVKELFPILLAAALYGPLWQGCTILCRCDNMAVVSVLKSRYASDRRLMHLLRLLFFLESHFHFYVVAQHLPGRHNSLADSISRNNHQVFLKECLSMSKNPTPISPSLITLLFLQEDWTSSTWQMKFKSCINYRHCSIHTKKPTRQQ